MNTIETYIREGRLHWAREAGWQHSWLRCHLFPLTTRKRVVLHRSNWTRNAFLVWAPMESWKRLSITLFHDSLPEQAYQGQQIELLNVLHVKTRESGSLFYNHKVRYLRGHSQVPWEKLLNTKWHVREEIAWCRSGAVGLPVPGTNHCWYRLLWWTHWCWSH